MNRRQLLAASLGVTLAGITSGARSQIDDRFEGNFFSKLEGFWSISRQFLDATITTDASVIWDSKLKAFQLEIDANNSQFQIASIGLSFNRLQNQYLGVFVGVFGRISLFGKGFGEVARAIRKVNSVEFEFDSPTGPLFYNFTWFAEKQLWVTTIESQAAGGTRVRLVTDTYTRSKQHDQNILRGGDV